MAKRSGRSKFTVDRIWTAFRLKPHRSEPFKLGKDRCSSRKLAMESYVDGDSISCP